MRPTRRSRTPRGLARHGAAQRWIRALLVLALLIVGSTAALVPRRSEAARPTLVALLVPRLEGQLNLNTATLDQLDLLPGVGPAIADRIVRYRDKHPFRSIRQLLRIEGIGPKTFERLRPFVVIDGESTLTVVPAG